MPRTIESLLLNGPAGRLEAMLEVPESGAPGEIALVCHPHPLYGGTMHNKVVHRLARALRRNGAAVLRINFRGVGASDGVHDNGRGEVDDARTALAWLRERYPSLPYTLAGFSFGSRTVLTLGCQERDAVRVIAAGYPARMGTVPAGCATPKVFILSTNDQFSPKQEFEALFETIQEPKQLIWIEAADHFFRDGLDRFEEVVFSLGPAKLPAQL